MRKKTIYKLYDYFSRQPVGDVKQKSIKPWLITTAGLAASSIISNNIFNNNAETITFAGIGAITFSVSAFKINNSIKKEFYYRRNLLVISKLENIIKNYIKEMMNEEIDIDISLDDISILKHLEDEEIVSYIEFRDGVSIAEKLDNKNYQCYFRYKDCTVDITNNVVKLLKKSKAK